MAQKKETALVRAILNYICSIGGDGYHVHGSLLQRRGEPDIDAAVPDGNGGFLHLKVECKVGKNEASPLQKSRLDRYSQMGYTVGVVKTLDEFKKLIGR